MKPKWTPGPWVALSIMGDKTSPFQIIATAPIWAKDSRLIASSFQKDGPEADANTLLMATSPELYDALERTARLASGEFDMICEQAEILEAARTALAKARGETA